MIEEGLRRNLRLSLSVNQEGKKCNWQADGARRGVCEEQKCHFMCKSAGAGVRRALAGQGGQGRQGREPVTASGSILRMLISRSA